MPQPNDDFTVFVIDPDVAFRDAMTLALAYRGYGLRQFSGDQDFLAARQDGWRGCVVAPLTTSQSAGLRLLAEGSARGPNALPVVLTALAPGLALVRQAFLGGAIDVLEKPVDLDQLLAAIERAMTRAQRAATQSVSRPAAELSALTRREGEVAQLMLRGLDNRSIGARLGISHRTVEVHKMRLMRKLGLRSLAGLIALVGLAPKRSRSRRQGNRVPV
jgi:two-component system, LuxR family, response regulator FixJ